MGSNVALYRAYDNGTLFSAPVLVITRKYGDAAFGGDLSAGTTLRSYGGRIVSQGGWRPSVGCYNTGNGIVVGMYGADNGSLAFGTMDAAGVPLTQWITFSTPGTGNFPSSVLFSSASVGNFYCAYDGSGSVINLLTGYLLQLNLSSGDLRYVNPLGAAWTVRRSDNGFIVGGANAWKPGGGPWGDSSDARIKNVEGEYKTGLDAICALRPVTYTYKGNDTAEEPEGAYVPMTEEEVASGKGKATPRSAPPASAPYPNSAHHLAATSGQKFTGLIAQEVEAIMPELITKRAGFIDGQPVTDLRDMDTTPLIFALINSVKELKAELDALKAAR